MYNLNLDPSLYLGLNDDEEKEVKADVEHLIEIAKGVKLSDVPYSTDLMEKEHAEIERRNKSPMSGWEARRLALENEILREALKTAVIKIKKISPT